MVSIDRRGDGLVFIGGTEGFGVRLGHLVLEDCVESLQLLQRLDHLWVLRLSFDAH
jgi:hypothetical protein